MAIKLNNWTALSVQQKNDVVRFLRGNCRIDREYPSRLPATPNSYLIADGTTSGGYAKKLGEEYRIYVKNIYGIPPFLDSELKERGTKNRIGGSAAIKAIMDYGGFNIGSN